MLHYFVLQHLLYSVESEIWQNTEPSVGFVRLPHWNKTDWQKVNPFYLVRVEGMSLTRPPLNRLRKESKLSLSVDSLATPNPRGFASRLNQLYVLAWTPKHIAGAGGGNRTLITCLEGRYTSLYTTPAWVLRYYSKTCDRLFYSLTDVIILTLNPLKKQNEKTINTRYDSADCYVCFWFATCFWATS